MDLNRYKHSTKIRVRTFEVDSQGVVHNAVYLQYLEIGRVEYRRSFGYTISNTGIFNDNLKVVVVNNTIDYHHPAFLDDELIIYTCIKWIKNSSFCFDQCIVNQNSKLICTAKGVLVNLNALNNLPETLPYQFVEEVKLYEPNVIVKNYERI